MVLSLDVGLNWVKEMSIRALVDNFTRNMVKDEIVKHWMNIGWWSLIGYTLCFISCLEVGYILSLEALRIQMLLLSTYGYGVL